MHARRERRPRRARRTAAARPAGTLARLPAAAALLALLSAAAPATGRASVMEWSGELSLGLGGFELLAATGTGLATLNEGLALEHLALPGGLHASTIVPITDPIVTAEGVVSVRASASLDAGTFRIDPVGTGGPPELTGSRLPLRGSLRQCLFYAGCNSGALTVPFTSRGTRGVGLGGTIVTGTLPPRISLLGDPWTIHTASVLVPTDVPTFNDTALPASTPVFAFGTLHGPLSFTWSAAATWGGEGGSVQLVTPVRVLGHEQVPVGGFGRLSLRFVPEPARLLAWASSALAVGALAIARLEPVRSRARRRPCACSSSIPPDAPSRRS